MKKKTNMLQKDHYFTKFSSLLIISIQKMEINACDYAKKSPLPHFWRCKNKSLHHFGATIYVLPIAGMLELLK